MTKDIIAWLNLIKWAFYLAVPVVAIAALWRWLV